MSQRRFTLSDGSTAWNHEGCLADLLNADILFANTRLFDPSTERTPSGKLDGPTVVLFVTANDVWYWACADARSIPLEDIPSLWEAWKADHVWGVIAWLCLREGLAPQAPIVKDMKAAGVWTPALDALPLPPAS